VSEPSALTHMRIEEAAERLGVAPRVLSNALTDRKLDSSRCPIVEGQRLIAVDYLPTIAGMLPWLACFERKD
jgi:hypothetical protein